MQETVFFGGRRGVLKDSFNPGYRNQIFSNQT